MTLVAGDAQFGEFQEEGFGSAVFEFDDGFHSGAVSVEGEDGAEAEAVVLYALAYLERGDGVGGESRGRRVG